MRSRSLFRAAAALLAIVCSVSASALYAQEPSKPAPQHHPWDNKALSPDQRARMVQKEMTLDEKIQLVHGTGWGALRPGAPIPPGDNWSAGFVPGIPRLGIPPINQQDSAVGVRLSA